MLLSLPIGNTDSFREERIVEFGANELCEIQRKGSSYEKNGVIRTYIFDHDFFPK